MKESQHSSTPQPRHNEIVLVNAIGQKHDLGVSKVSESVSTVTKEQEIPRSQDEEKRILLLNRLLLGIREINKHILRVREPSQLVAEVCKVLTKTRRYRRAHFELAEHGSQRTSTSAEDNRSLLSPNRDDSAPLEAFSRERPAGTGMSTGHGCVCNDTTPPPTSIVLDDTQADAMASVTSVPLVIGARILGAITVWLDHNETFDPEEVALLKDVASDLAFAVRSMEHERERQQAEKRLRQLSRAVDQTASIVLITDARGSIEYANPRFVETTGYSLDEVLGKNPRLLKSGHTPDSIYTELWKTITSGHTWRGVFHNRKKSGDFYWEQASISPVCDDLGMVSHFVAVKEDITANKLAEEALRQSETRFRSLFEFAPDAVFLYDLEGRFTDGNRAAESLVGYAREELIGKDFVASNLFSESELLRAAMALGRNVRGEATGPEEFVLKRKDGREVGAEIRTFPISIADKPMVLGIARDISERKLLEAQLRQAQKLEGIGQLAGGVAHDFNNLLAVIRGNADLILMDTDQYSTETNECLNQIVLAAERGANMTRQLLIFSRKQAMKTQPLRLDSLVQNLTKMLKRVIRADVHLECRCAIDLPFVQADPGMIEQVLLNLVINARDAMPDGGQLCVAAEGVSLDASYVQTHPEARAGKFACLRVSDTGTGVAPEHLERIFEPFFTTKEAGKGTGLGLATVYGIVKQHQGWVTLSSQVGKGSTFSVFLPTIPAPSEEASNPTELELLGGGETILLVEDEYSVRVILRQVLETFRYKVYEASCASEARNIWARHSGEIALLLTDMVMPEGIMGRALAEGLRGEKPELKAILMSGYSEEVAGKDTAFFRRTGSYFLQKPCATTTLLRTVRNCLDGKAQNEIRNA